jgi:putative pyruvate formate lyase activating enzyme
MDRSRREFLKNSARTAGLLTLAPLGCTTKGQQTTPPARPARTGKPGEPAYLALERSGELKRREEKLWSFFSSCRCCPRKCGTNRIAGKTGRCSATAQLKVASMHPHFGEERPLVGMSGSGTIFFSHCNLLCCFCQNWQINHRGDGRIISHSNLADMMINLQRRGCHNINLVTPTHVVPNIIKALRIAIRRGLKLPLVYNTGGYDNLEVIKLMDGIADIYLPDYKYTDGKMSAKYSSGASDYPRTAAKAIKEMHRQTGVLKTDWKGVATRGVILRHLVMPHNIAGTDRLVKWVAKDLSVNTYINIMGQYHPAHRAFDYPKIARRVTRAEMRQALRWAKQAGLKRIAT